MSETLSVLLSAIAASGSHGVDNADSRFWCALLVNTVYFTGMAQASVVLALIYRTTRSTWSPGFERIALHGVYFLPLSLILIPLALLGGGETIYPWARDPHMLHGGKAQWLSLKFVLSRDLAAAALMCGLSWRYFRIYLRPQSEERYRKMAFSAPTLIFLYVVCWGLIAFDLLMSVDPHWYSNLFGAYVWISNVYLAWAVNAIIAAVLWRKTGFTKEISVDAFHDVGKMTFAFCAVTMYFLWSQFFVIWYGNLPEEAPFVIARTDLTMWGKVGAVFLVIALLIPFVSLLSRKLKRTPPALFTVASIALVGMLIERYFLVLPSVFPRPVRFLSGVELVVSVVFAVIYTGCAFAFVRKHPPSGTLVEHHD